jgi:hypothetical protein
MSPEAVPNRFAAQEHDQVVVEVAAGRAAMTSPTPRGPAQLSRFARSAFRRLFGRDSWGRLVTIAGWDAL